MSLAFRDCLVTFEDGITVRFTLCDGFRFIQTLRRAGWAIDDDPDGKPTGTVRLTMHGDRRLLTTLRQEGWQITRA